MAEIATAAYFGTIGVGIGLTIPPKIDSALCKLIEEIRCIGKKTKLINIRSSPDIYCLLAVLITPLTDAQRSDSYTLTYSDNNKQTRLLAELPIHDKSVYAFMDIGQTKEIRFYMTSLGSYCDTIKVVYSKDDQTTFNDWFEKNITSKLKIPISTDIHRIETVTIR